MNIEFVNTLSANSFCLQYFVHCRIFTERSIVIHRYETIDGKLHNIYDSANMYYTSSGELAMIEYYINHLLHRLYKPAKILFSHNQVDTELYSIEGQTHNEYGPAVVNYSNGKFHEVSYVKHGKHHNENGPARIIYDDNGNELFTFHFINGIRQPNDSPLDFNEVKLINYLLSLPT